MYDIQEMGRSILVRRFKLVKLLVRKIRDRTEVGHMVIRGTLGIHFEGLHLS